MNPTLPHTVTSNLVPFMASELPTGPDLIKSSKGGFPLPQNGFTPPHVRICDGLRSLFM